MANKKNIGPDLYQVKNPAEVKLFGMHLRRLREAKGYSQQELADIANVARNTVQRIENARFAATIDIMISLSEAFQIPLRELVDFSTPEKSLDQGK